MADFYPRSCYRSSKVELEVTVIIRESFVRIRIECGVSPKHMEELDEMGMYK